MAVERLGWPARLISREAIRAGTPKLLRDLRQGSHEIWLYTTSLRSAARLRLWFLAFGVRLDGIVNQEGHNAQLAHRSMTCSKYPPAFGIELLVDDSEGVAREGKQLGFAVLRIEDHDASWCARVAAMVRDRNTAIAPRT